MRPSPRRTPPWPSGSAQLQNTAYVEQIARQEYGLVMPGEQAYAILPPPADHHHGLAGPRRDDRPTTADGAGPGRLMSAP